MKDILNIPDDILLYIIKYLDLCDIEKLYLSMSISQKKNLINLLNINLLKIDKILILYNLLCTGNNLNFLRVNLINFQTDELCIMDSNYELLSIIHTPIKIKKLVLQNSQLSKEDLIDLLGKNINSLHIKNCIDITEDIFNIIEEKCFDLEELIMCIDFIVSLKKIINIFKKCNKLKFIKLNLLFIDDDLKKVKNNKLDQYITINRENIMKIK